MKQPMTDQTELSEHDILEWLRDHPDFLNRHPDVLDLFAVPKKEQGKGIIDFQHYMVERLKADREEVMASAREIVETSRANQTNQDRIHRAILTLLDAPTFEDFVKAITMDVTSVLGVDIIALLVEAEGPVIPHIDISGVRAVPPGTIEASMKDRRVLLQSNIEGYDEVYGGGAGLVKSQALLRLNLTGGLSPVLLAFGSRDPVLFEEGQGTELISFLGAVIERGFRIWLDLPR